MFLNKKTHFNDAATKNDDMTSNNEAISLQNSIKGQKMVFLIPDKSQVETLSLTRRCRRISQPQPNLMIFEPLKGLYLLTVLHFAGFFLRRKMACVTKRQQNYEATDEQNRYDVLEQSKMINNNDSVFVIYGNLWPWLVTITETLMAPDITKTECNNCYIIHCLLENNDQHAFAQ